MEVLIEIKILLISAELEIFMKYAKNPNMPKTF